MTDSLDYKSHVSRQVCNRDSEAVYNKIDALESAWPEYKEATCLTCLPLYVIDTLYDLTVLKATNDMTTMHTEGITWLQTYVGEDVEKIQKMKQCPPTSP